MTNKEIVKLALLCRKMQDVPYHMRRHAMPITSRKSRTLGGSL